MTDWKKLGLKAGLEIHQQLNTHKLFCLCPSEIRDDEPDLVVRRRLRASAGETGEIDVAAAHEQQKQKYYEYQGYHGSTCLIELDEEPIHEMNNEALSVVLSVAKVLQSDVVDLIEVMRKTVVDGSNTSGFQRTCLVARNGKVPSSEGDVGIETVCLEEDSAKIETRDIDHDTYNLTRLGIPLIEIATAPDIKTPQHAKEVAEYLGMILRSTGRVKRGLGTIRQDLNVSITGGQRVEIKGAQDLRMIAKLVELEAMRQQSLLGLVDVNPKIGEKVDISDIAQKSESKLLQKPYVAAVKLVGMKGIVGKELIPGRRLGKELSEYARVVAGAGGAVHTDELPAYGITQEDVDAISAKLGCGEKDAFILVSDEKDKVLRGLDAIAMRIGMLKDGVPKEVRKANQDGSSSFLRPMPGAARMYPETDTVSVVPSKNVEEVVLLTEKAKGLQELGISADLATQLTKSHKLEQFQELSANLTNVDAVFLANTLLTVEKELRKRYGVETVKKSAVEDVLRLLNDSKISKEAAIEVIALVAKGKSLDDAASQFKLLSDEELAAEIERIKKAHKNLPANALIGRAMAELRGRADGKKIVELLKK